MTNSDNEFERRILPVAGAVQPFIGGRILERAQPMFRRRAMA
jgi:hypothetical protein